MIIYNEKYELKTGVRIFLFIKVFEISIKYDKIKK